jgi:hypothetical protein
MADEIGCLLYRAATCCRLARLMNNDHEVDALLQAGQDHIERALALGADASAVERARRGEAAATDSRPDMAAIAREFINRHGFAATARVRAMAELHRDEASEDAGFWASVATMIDAMLECGDAGPAPAPARDVGRPGGNAGAG